MQNLFEASGLTTANVIVVTLWVWLGILILALALAFGLGMAVGYWRCKAKKGEPDA